MTVFILGGGPAGLAIADALGEAGEGFVLIERDQVLGGLARTVDWAGHGAHDLGPHKIFTVDAALAKRVRRLLPEDAWLEREKKSRIYLGGRFLDYPPSPFSLAGVFGLRRFIAMCWGYGWAMLAGMLPGRRQPRNFEEDIRGRLGSGLYEVLFQPIALKIWGDPAELDVKLSRGRIQTPSITEIISTVLGLRRRSAFEALNFSYPKGGLRRLWDAIEARSREHGRFVMGQAISAIEVADGRVVALELAGADGAARERIKIGPGDFVASTLPLGLLPKLMGGGLSAATRSAIAASVQLNDLLLVFLKIESRRLSEDSWVFVPDPAIAFHRVSEQASFDPGMTPDGSILCCEIMNTAAGKMGDLSDEALVALAREGLARMGHDGISIVASKVVRLPRSYPVYRPGYAEPLANALAELDSLANFRTLGRQGAFNYIGTLDAMDIGYGFARWHAARQGQGWPEERERTRHYPVLD